MELDDVWRRAVLTMRKVKETYARNLDGDIGCLEGCRCGEAPIKFRSSIGDLRRKKTTGSDAAGKWYFGDHGMALVVLENQVVVGIALCSSFQLVVCQSRIQHENRFLCGSEASSRRYRIWWR